MFQKVITVKKLRRQKGRFEVSELVQPLKKWQFLVSQVLEPLF